MTKPVQFSVLDLASVRLGGTIAESFQNTVALARHVERLSFTRFWLAEHHNMPGVASAATSVLIGHVASSTSRIRVGSGGIMLPNHAALMIAEQFGTLETLYPGRIDLGVGRAPGSDQLAAHALRRGLNNSVEDFPRQVVELLSYLAPERPGQRLRAVPGAGTNVPVWLLGSSTFSAQLAAQMGLPFAFASHFAPELLLPALQIYRRDFEPSQYLDKPRTIVGVPVIAAESDAQANHLATSPKLRFLKLIRGEPTFTPPPVESMEGLWAPDEQAAVESRLGVAIVGGPETVERKLIRFLEDTKADELMITTDVYEQAARLRSFEILASIAQRLNADSSDH